MGQSLSKGSKMRLVITVLVLLGLAELGCCYMDRQAMSRLTRKLKGKHYMKEVMPQLEYKSAGEDNPLTVTVNAFIRTIVGLDTNKGQLGVQMTFRQEWTDGRFSPVCADAFQGDEKMFCAQLYGEDVDLAWHPDTFFRNEVDSWAHDHLVKNNFLRVYPEGELVNSQRVTTWLKCPEAIGAAQDQVINCSMMVASWGFSNQDLIYQWKQDQPLKFKDDNKDGLQEVTTNRCDVTTDTGTYSCLEATFKIKVDYENAPHYKSDSYQGSA